MIKNDLNETRCPDEIFARRVFEQDKKEAQRSLLEALQDNENSE